MSYSNKYNHFYYYNNFKMYNNYKVNNFNIINLNKFKKDLHTINNKYKLSR